MRQMQMASGDGFGYQKWAVNGCTKLPILGMKMYMKPSVFVGQQCFSHF
jgi:hypothetical protein